jgi:hypothetical protein
VTLRVVRDFPRLRDERTFDAIRGVLERYVDGDFRICQLSLQHNHIHSLKEADSAEAFTTGIRSFTMNAAKALNAVWGRAGRVFEDRYHSRQITDARGARNALAYVLCNWRHHREDFYDGESRAAALDRYSSAVTFEGWTERFSIPADYRPLPVSQPRTRLLATDWKRYGRIDPSERPGERPGRLF